MRAATVGDRPRVCVGNAQAHFESLVILQQTMRDQLEKIKSKPGILKKQLFNLSIGDLEEYPRFGAFERLRAAVFARE